MNMKKKDYAKEKRTAFVLIVMACIWIFLGVVFVLAGGAFYIEAKAGEIESRSRAEEFDPWSVQNLNHSWKFIHLQGLSYDFAEDFKGTYHYYLAFTDCGDIRVVKMKGDLAPEYEPYVEYLFSEEGSDAPEPMMIRGTVELMEEDIREFAMETLNYLFGEEYVTEENFNTILGSCVLDLTKKPVGSGDFEGAYICLLVGGIFLAGGILTLILQIKKRKAAVLAMEREKQAFAMMRTYQNPEPGPQAADGDFIPATNYDTFRPQAEETDPLEEIASGNTLKQNGNIFFGILGAIGGSLLGAVLWILIGYAGFIAGIAGFVMLKFALVGYRKFSGRLDKKGAFFCLFLAAVMIFAANVMDFGIVICRAFFEYEASMDTVRYVAANFTELMGEGELWPDFIKNLVIGYGLSIWSSNRLIGAILKYKEGE